MALPGALIYAGLICLLIAQNIVGDVTGEVTELTAYSFLPNTFVFPNATDYRNVYRWRINASNLGDILHLTVTHNPQSSTRCSAQQLLIYDGFASDPRPKRLSCKQERYTFISTGAYFYVEYRPESVTSSMQAEMTYYSGNSICGGPVMVQTAYGTKRNLSTPNYPYGYPGAGSACSWLLQADLEMHTLHLDVLQTQFYPINTCPDGFLSAYEGQSDQGAKLGSFCDSYKKTYSSQGRYLFVVSRAQNTDSRNGFTAQYYSTRQESAESRYVGGIVGAAVCLFAVTVLLIIIIKYVRNKKAPVVAYSAMPSREDETEITEEGTVVISTISLDMYGAPD